eukprot:COSAG03_NODE_1830_length_3461_cov_4.027365_3_plen_121_part_00
MPHYGDLRQWYGVDWDVLTAAGMTVPMTGYGNPDVTPTRQALIKGSQAVGRGTTAVPRLVCGVHHGTQANFAERWATCDGAMEYDDNYDFDHSSGFHVPSFMKGDDVRAAMNASSILSVY